MKKFISIMLSVIMLSSVSFVYAGEISDTIQNVITSVKEKIDIPDEFSEFDYSIGEYDGKEDYNLTWTKTNPETNEEEKSIIAVIDKDSNLINYEKFDYSKDNEVDFSKKISKDEALQYAKDFIKKVMPSVSDEYSVLDYNTSNALYSFTFSRVKNGVPVKFNRFYIDVYSDTGEIQSFRSGYKNVNDDSFESTDSVAKKDDAINSLLQSGCFKPQYYFNYDYQKKEGKVFLAYPSYLVCNKSVDAKTLDIVKPADDFIVYKEADTMETGTAKAGLADTNNLSEIEISKIEESKDIITKEKAQELINANIPSNIKFGELNYSTIFRKNVDKDQYVWSFNYENGYASIDAKTKEILGFYCYDTYKVDRDIPKEVSSKRKALANDLIQKLAPAKLNNIELSEENSTNSELYFVRKVNGYDFQENGIVIIFDDKDNIIDYNCFWYNSVKFPNPTKIIEPKTAFDIIDKDGKFGLSYEIIEQNQVNPVTLTYSLTNGENVPPYIDASTGEKLGYDGEVYEEEFKAPESYKDIAGHWCEKYANKLLEMGLFVKRDMLLPDEKITKEDFNKAYNRYNIDTDDIFSGDSEFITRREVCRFVTEIFDYKKIVDKQNLFKNVFSDVDESDADFGSIAIANALGIVTADANGKFDPDRDITNAEAVKIIYFICENGQLL